MIFYFSGTGNTRWVAEQIAKGIGEALVSIPDMIREGRNEFELREGERIGFCFPTHGWQVPRICRNFIRQLSLKNKTSTTFCWGLTTCGDNTGGTAVVSYHQHHQGLQERHRGAGERGHSPTLLIRDWCLLQCTNGYRQEIHGRSGCMYPVRQVRENMPCGQHKRYTAEMDS